MNIDSLKQAVNHFGAVWFPGTDPENNQPFWFRARNAKHAPIIRELCESCMHIVNQVLTTATPPDTLLLALRDWSQAEILTLSIMLDQMPRNALAIGFGGFSELNPLDVAAAIDDSYSLSLARTILDKDNTKVDDYRITCFFSLIFRHSNDFVNARKVLSSFSRPLPPLAEKFWAETNKRESSIK